MLTGTAQGDTGDSQTVEVIGLNVDIALNRIVELAGCNDGQIAGLNVEPSALSILPGIGPQDALQGQVSAGREADAAGILWQQWHGTLQLGSAICEEAVGV